MYTIKIKNLPRWISEIHLKQAFAGCGKIISAQVALDQNTLRPLGHGFITFVDELGMNKGLERDNTMLDGETISVEYADMVESVI